MNEREDTPVMAAIKREAVERAIAALNECADDLEAELRARYPEETIEAYPSERRRFERDMRSVLNARLAINGLRSHGMGWPAGEGADE